MPRPADSGPVTAFRAATVAMLVAAAVVLVPAGARAGGHLVLNGGGSKPAVVMKKFIELAGGPEARIVVVSTASEDPTTPRYYRTLFEDDYGCTDVHLAMVSNRQDAARAAVVAAIESAGGIFFAGGDQRRITSAWHDTPAAAALRAAFERGAVIGGTSAGTACQSPLMITGDGDFTVLTEGAVELWPGLGLLDGVILDQHFVARQRQNRLITVVLEHPELLGIGVDEATAIWVRPDHTLEVLGEGWVMVFDAAAAEITRGGEHGTGHALGARGVLTHVLLPGDVFDLEARRVVAPQS